MWKEDERVWREKRSCSEFSSVLSDCAFSSRTVLSSALFLYSECVAGLEYDE